MNRKTLRRPSHTSPEPKKPKWSVDEALKLAQVVSIVGAAAWTLISFFSFERERSQVALAQQKIALEQSTLLAKTEEQRSKISLQILEHEKTLKASQARDVTRGSIAVGFESSIECAAKKGQYTANFTYRFENVSKADAEVSWTLLHNFIGVMDKEKAGDSVEIINRPPIPYLHLGSEGPVSWKDMGHQGSTIEGDSWLLWKLSSGEFEFKPGRGGTRPLHPGEKSTNTENIVISVDPSKAKYLGITFGWGVDKITKGEGVYHHVDWLALPDCNSPSQKKSLKPLAILP